MRQKLLLTVSFLIFVLLGFHYNAIPAQAAVKCTELDVETCRSSFKECDYFPDCSNRCAPRGTKKDLVCSDDYPNNLLALAEPATENPIGAMFRNLGTFFHDKTTPKEAANAGLGPCKDNQGKLCSKKLCEDLKPCEDGLNCKRAFRCGVTDKVFTKKCLARSESGTLDLVDLCKPKAAAAPAAPAPAAPAVDTKVGPNDIILGGYVQRCVPKDKPKVEIQLNMGVSDALGAKVGNPSFLRVKVNGGNEQKGRLDGNNNTSVIYQVDPGKKVEFSLDAVKDKRGPFQFDETIASKKYSIDDVIDCKSEATRVGDGAPAAEQAETRCPPSKIYSIKACRNGGYAGCQTITCDNTEVCVSANNPVCPGTQSPQQPPAAPAAAPAQAPAADQSRAKEGQGNLPVVDMPNDLGQFQFQCTQDKRGAIYFFANRANPEIGKTDLKFVHGSNAVTSGIGNLRGGAWGFGGEDHFTYSGIDKKGVNENSSYDITILAYPLFQTKNLGTFTVNTGSCKAEAPAAESGAAAPPGNIKEQLGPDQYDIWVGAYCEVVYKDHHGENSKLDDANGNRCSQAVVRAGCQNQPVDSDPAHPDLINCIKTAANNVFQPTTPAASPGGAGTGGAPAAAVPGVPAGYNTAFDKHVYAWCSGANGVDLSKSPSCNSEAISTCGSKTDKEEFIACVKQLTHNKYGGSFNPSQAQGGQQPEQQQYKILALVLGRENVGQIDISKPVDISAKAFAADDEEQKCSIIDVTLSLTKTKDENGNSINPIPIVNAVKTTNCQPYTKITLQGAGHYTLAVLGGSAASSQEFDAVKSQGTGGEVKGTFSCSVGGSISQNTITATVAPKTPDKDTLGYDRAEWYIKKGKPTSADPSSPDSLAYHQDYNKGSNCQFAGKNCQNPPNPDGRDQDGHDNTLFKNLEPGEYYIQAVAYPLNGKDKSVPCDFKQFIVSPKLAKANTSRVLAETSDDLSGVVMASGQAIDCDGVCNVIIKSIGYDRQPIQTLFEGEIIGSQSIPYTINDLARVYQVETVIVPANAPQNAVTLTDSMPQLAGYKPAPERGQSIELSKSTGEVFTEYDTVDLIAETNLPLGTGELAFVEGSQRFPVQERKEECTATNSIRCVYTARASGQLLNPGVHSFQLVLNSTPFAEAGTLNFTISPIADQGAAAPAQASAVTTTAEVTKITLSRYDDSDEQVIYTLDPTTSQEYYADADFDLNVGDNQFKYTVYYNFSDVADPDNVHYFVAERSAQPESPAVEEEGTEQPAPVEEPAKEETAPKASEACDNVGEYDRVCIADGVYKFRQCQANNTWSDYLGSETNPDNPCRNE